MWTSKPFTRQTKTQGLPLKTPALTPPVARAKSRSPFTHHMQRAIGNYATQARAEKSGKSIIQRTCACGGTCASCARKNTEDQTVQPRLTVGPAHDVYEQEADRVAAHVMRMPAVPGQPDHEAGTVRIQRRVSPATSHGQAPSGLPEVSLPASSGQPLASSTRQYMEPRFGTDFSQVRVHSGPAAQETAAQIQARAFTHGANIWLGQGATERDTRLMAHELTHVVQQQGAHEVSPTSSGDASSARAGVPSSPTIQRLPFGITLPTGLRFLDSTERTMATGIYGGSLNFSKILLSDAVGGGGRPFTTYVPSPVSGIDGGTVINIGPTAYATPGSNRNLLIHELAHSWQSQHHPNPAQFMVNSIASQAGAALAGGSAYCYVPGKYFGLYGAEQIAEQVEKGESAIIAEVASASPGATHLGNVLSLQVPHWETRGDPGVKC